VVPFQDCTEPDSVTLTNPRLAALSKCTAPLVLAIRRHCMVPSFSNTDATAPEAEATKIRSEASAA